MFPNPDTSILATARLIGVSPGTLYNRTPDLSKLRTVGGARRVLPAGATDLTALFVCGW